MIFFFWSGWGFLVPVIWIGFFVLTQAGLNAVIGPNTYESAEWPKLLAGILSAVTIWFVGKRVNGEPGRTLIDKKTGHEFVFKPRSTFFFIPMEYWAVAVAVLAVIFSFTK